MFFGECYDRQCYLVCDGFSVLVSSPELKVYSISRHPSVVCPSTFSNDSSSETEADAFHIPHIVSVDGKEGIFVFFVPVG